jgi:hypothetical protein
MNMTHEELKKEAQIFIERYGEAIKALALESLDTKTYD